MNTIKVKGVTKIYDSKTTAVDDASLTIEPNKIYGLLGRNGAGKTTLLNLMTDKIFPTEGEITIAGLNVNENDKMLASMFYMMQTDAYPLSMKVKELFKWTKKFYVHFDMDYASALAKKFQLDITKKIHELSTGYRSIFKDILALASNAEIVLFDEPVLGLDTNHRDMFYRELIKNYSQKPKTIIVSTHIIDEVADVIEEVIIINKGKIIREQSVENFLSSAYVIAGREDKVDKYLENREFIIEETIGALKIATVMESEKNKNEKLAKELNIELSNVELQKLFITITR
ncbi:MAG: ABC transporter ATP-binding protein [Clostridiales bacterium]|nr:ABC transporter ATP-binding protein [Clostridiales bacterium]